MVLANSTGCTGPGSPRHVDLLDSDDKHRHGKSFYLHKFVPGAPEKTKPRVHGLFQAALSWEYCGAVDIHLPDPRVPDEGQGLGFTVFLGALQLFSLLSVKIA